MLASSFPAAHRCVDERPVGTFHVRPGLSALASVKPDRRRRQHYSVESFCAVSVSPALCSVAVFVSLYSRVLRSGALNALPVLIRCVVIRVLFVRHLFCIRCVVTEFFCRIIVRRSVVRSSSPQRQVVGAGVRVSPVSFSSSFNSLRRHFLSFIILFVVQSCVHRQLSALECVLRFCADIM